jgi:acetyl esterase/lipase
MLERRGARILPVAVLLVACGLVRAQTPAPQTVLLWPDGAPGAQGGEEADKPTLTIYLPPAEKAAGTGVVVCPGGGYARLAMEHEGKQVAEWLNSLGVAAFVLKYRLGPRYHHPVQLGDARRAIRYVRQQAGRLGVDPTRVGIMGFSAGGHLASTAATHFDAGDARHADPVERFSSRPDFAVLCYPVITLKPPHAHAGSRRMLLGENPDAKLVDLLSNDERVTPETPPTFLFHTTEDTAVPPENSVLFYLALRRAGVRAELHVYERGRHGVGLAPTDPVLSSWPDRLKDWLKINGWLTRPAEQK